MLPMGMNESGFRIKIVYFYGYRLHVCATIPKALHNFTKYSGPYDM
jgi:hypothetical protein